jgi:hypothetical protein
MAEALTYNSLLTDIAAYAERSELAFTNQIPRFVMLAENRIAREVRNLGFVKYVNGQFSAVGGNNNPVLPKPARWRQTIAMHYVSAAGERIQLYTRSYDYCRNYWPNSSAVNPPEYYADYDYEHWLVVPSPDSTYNFEVAYHERPTPLDNTTQTSWTTQYAPQLLLYACMMEASLFLKNMDKFQLWQTVYQAEIAGLQAEELIRADTDRASDRKQA